MEQPSDVNNSTTTGVRWATPVACAAIFKTKAAEKIMSIRTTLNATAGDFLISITSHRCELSFEEKSTEEVPEKQRGRPIYNRNVSELQSAAPEAVGLEVQLRLELDHAR